MADLHQQDGKRTLRSSGSIAFAGMRSRSSSSSTTTSVAHPKNSIRFTSGNSTTDNSDSDSGNAARNTTTLYNYFDVYETPDCRVSSNDPPADGGLAVTPASLQICNITQYTCASSSSIEVDTLTIQVPFAYELYYRSDNLADLQHYILPHLEESMLLHLAETLGIAQCRQRQQRRQRQLNRRHRHLASEGTVVRNRNVQDTTSTSGTFVGASIEPRDQVNDECDQCRTNYTTTQNNGFKYDCVPMRGEMTVFVQPQSNDRLAEEKAIRDKVSLYIQEAMQEDVLVATGYIPKVVYMDEDAAPCANTGGGAATAVDAVSSSNGGASAAHWSRLKIGLVAGLAAFVLLLLLLLCCCCCLCCGGAGKWRRRQQRANADSASDSADANGTVQPRTASRSLGSRRDYRRRPMSPRLRGNAMVAPIAGTFSGPMWGAASVDDDGEDGVERCLASRDSLALRGRGPNGKPTYDEESVGTTRTSVASGSVVAMVRGDSDDGNERDSPTVHEEIELLSDNNDDTSIDGEHINADDSQEQSDEEAGTGTMERATNQEPAAPSKSVASKAIQAEDFELLDRLAQRPLSPEGDDDDDDVASNSVQTRDYMAARSLSPTSGSQITALAGNLQKRPWGGGTRAGNQQRAIYQGSPGSPPLSPRSDSYSTATATRLETIEPPTLMYPSMSRQYRSPPPTIDTEAQALSGNLRYPAQYATTTAPRTPPPMDDRSASIGRTTMASRMFRSPTATRTRAPEAPLSPASTSSASTNNSSRHRQQQPPVVQPENHETFTYGRLAAPILGPHLRSSTYGSVATAGTTRTTGTTGGHLAPSSTYGSHATLRTGNLGPRRSSAHSPPRSPSAHQYGGDSVAMMQAPDSFDEEIMGIISEEDEEPARGVETPYAKDAVHHGPNNATATAAIGMPYHDSDVLNGHGSYYYPDPDGPGMNDAYVSEDSDSQLSSNDQQQQQQQRSLVGMGYNTTDEHAKRRLQMS
jgi:hypothetical protein